MANISVKYFSEALNRKVQFEIYLPNDKPDEQGRKMKTLFLLHGYTGDAYNWVPEHLAQKYNFAVVTPNGENGFWLDGLSTGHKYCTFVGAELVDYVRRTFNLAQNADETYIMGLSMGGFGAMKCALTYPDRFGAAASFSGAVDIADTFNLDRNPDEIRRVFGSLKHIRGSEADTFYLMKENAEAWHKPLLYVSCGTADFLYPQHLRFVPELKKYGWDVTAVKKKGAIHEWGFWDEEIKAFIDFIYEDR